ncbi:MAG: phosphoglycolate phosphatase [Gammaproteobacteria bacterium]
MNRSLTVRAVLFDLDGTLIDSAADLAHAANLALAGAGYPPRPVTEVQAFIGDGAEKLIHRCLTGELHRDADPDLHAATYANFQSHYAKCLLDRTRPYPGVVETLENLKARGIALGCVTNKPERFTLPLLEGLGLSRYFRITLGGDTLRSKKPDPAPLLHAAKHCDADRDTATMVGDSLTDLRAARAALMRIVCVDYGYSGQVDLSTHAPDALISDLRDLLPLL